VRYNVFVNDVPLFGAEGKPVLGLRQTIEESVELTHGRNKIEVSALNKLGIETLRDHRVVEYIKQTDGDLYYLGFGVSKYADPSLTLKYASKDALDLEAMLKRAKGKFNHVYTRVFADETATLDAVSKAKKFLEPAGVDDTVVLFVAGHGVYDDGDTPNYYYLTHDADLSRLDKTAARFELIEDLLQNIKPRNKLFLIDTCHSGELSPSDEAARLTGGNYRPLTARGIRKKNDAQSNEAVVEKAFFDHDRYIYNNLFRRSGAIVLSSSRGAEWSFESDDIQNGIFTEEILKALGSNFADTNKDKSVSTEELRDYVIRTVADKTDGRQHPTVDRDNLENTFSLPLIK
jgi:hypothetical protein